MQYASTGQVVLSNYTTKRTVMNAVDEKESVDSGKFVPGVYRVNPYRRKQAYWKVLQQEVERVYNPGGYYKYRVEYKGYPTSEALLYWMNNNDPVTLTEPRKQLALQKAYGKLGSADLALGEDIGELRETIQMIKSPLKALVDFIGNARGRHKVLLDALANRKRDFVAEISARGDMEAINAAVSTWLEIRYGLRPLIGLVQDAVEKIAEKERKVFDPNLIRSVKSTLEFPDTSGVAPYEWRNGNIWFKISGKVDEMIRVHASVQYKQTKALSPLDQWGLTPRFLPETAWQLARASFVVDWFISIGPWLESLRVNPDITVLGNTVGTLVSRTYSTTDHQARYNNSACHYEPFNDEAEVTAFEFRRETNVDLSYLPHFTYGRTLDLWKAIDSIALIWQTLPQRWRR
jgi:hypothetical protein